MEWLRNHYNQQSLQSTVKRLEDVLMPLVPASHSLCSKLQTISSLWLGHHLMHCGWDSDLPETWAKGKGEKCNVLVRTKMLSFMFLYCIPLLQQECSVLTRLFLDSMCTVIGFSVGRTRCKNVSPHVNKLKIVMDLSYILLSREVWRSGFCVTEGVLAFYSLYLRFLVTKQLNHNMAVLAWIHFTLKD